MIPWTLSKLYVPEWEEFYILFKYVNTVVKTILAQILTLSLIVRSWIKNLMLLTMYFLSHQVGILIILHPRIRKLTWGDALCELAIMVKQITPIPWLKTITMDYSLSLWNILVFLLVSAGPTLT